MIISVKFKTQSFAYERLFRHARERATNLPQIWKNINFCMLNDKDLATFSSCGSVSAGEWRGKTAATACHSVALKI